MAVCIFTVAPPAKHVLVSSRGDGGARLNGLGLLGCEGVRRIARLERLSIHTVAAYVVPFRAPQRGLFSEPRSVSLTKPAFLEEEIDKY